MEQTTAEMPAATASGGWAGRLSVRSATLADVAILRRLVNASFAEHRASGANLTGIDQDEQATADRMAGREVWLALVDRRPAATVSLELRSGDEVGEISQFAVAPRFKGRGLGSRLLELAEERLRTLGAAEVRLSTPDCIPHLVRFYRHRGYREIGTVRRPGKNYDSVVLAKSLSPT